jgi:hypothetical protein
MYNFVTYHLREGFGKGWFLIEVGEYFISKPVTLSLVPG